MFFILMLSCVAPSLWMIKDYVTEYGMELATAASLAACFSLPGEVLRAVGSWISEYHSTGVANPCYCHERIAA